MTIKNGRSRNPAGLADAFDTLRSTDIVEGKGSGNHTNLDILPVADLSQTIGREVATSPYNNDR